MNRELLQRVLKVLKVKRLRLDEHLIPIIVEEIEQELAKPEQEPQLTDAGADTNITRGLEPKGSGMVTLNQVGMRVDLKDAPPRKEWVGLTEHEIWECQKPGLSDDVYKLIEAKLRERNT
jgi:hypothetical protein